MLKLSWSCIGNQKSPSMLSLVVVNSVHMAWIIQIYFTWENWKNLYPTPRLCLWRTRHIKSRKPHTFISQRSFLLLNHSNLLRVIYSLLEVFSPQKIIWWGRNSCGVTQMQISTLNFSWWQQRVDSHSTWSWWVHTRSLTRIQWCVFVEFRHESFQNCFWIQLFPPLHVLWITP